MRTLTEYLVPDINDVDQSDIDGIFISSYKLNMLLISTKDVEFIKESLQKIDHEVYEIVDDNLDSSVEILEDNAYDDIIFHINHNKHIKYVYIVSNDNTWSLRFFEEKNIKEVIHKHIHVDKIYTDDITPDNVEKYLNIH